MGADDASAGTGTAGDWALAGSLAVAVPMHMAEVQDLPPWRRAEIGSECASVIGGQGDTLMYGSSAKFGNGAKEAERHRKHGSAEDKDCRVCVTGQARCSAGEVFNYLARGLAVAACQPGGVTFAGIHWCAFSHPHCPAPGARPPSCCPCDRGCGETSRCPEACEWCRNGCAAAGGRMCCTEEAGARQARIEEIRARRTEPVQVAGEFL